MIFKGYGLVWDAEKDKPLAEFVDGKFETKSKKVIDKLTKLGFENDGNTADEINDTPPEDQTPPADA